MTSEANDILQTLAEPEPIAVEVMTLLADPEVLKVLHVKLYELGWHRSWGYEAHSRIANALTRLFANDDAHLKSR